MSPNRVKNSIVNDVNSGVVGIGFLKANVLVSEYLVRVGRVPATFVDIFRFRRLQKGGKSDLDWLVYSSVCCVDMHTHRHRLVPITYMTYSMIPDQVHDSHTYSWTAERLLCASPNSLTKLYMQTKHPLINPRPVLDSLVQ